MSTEHKNLTGTSLHESKGVDAASSGQVYIANGLGSGVWTDKNADNLVFNKYTLQDIMTDIGTANDNVYFHIPYKSNIFSLTIILYGAIAAANAIVSIYVNGVVRPETLTCSFAGSTAGSKFTLSSYAAHTINANDTIEIKTDGGPSGVTKAAISLTLQAKV